VKQTLRIVAFDMDNPKLPLEKQDYLGEIIIDLAAIAGLFVAIMEVILKLHAHTLSLLASGGRITRSLVNAQTKKKPGTITITMTEIRESSMSAVLKFGARGLDKKVWYYVFDCFPCFLLLTDHFVLQDLFGKSDGFLRISKPVDASLSSWVAVHQTEVKNVVRSEIVCQIIIIVIIIICRL
jgi:hypothetical protein